MVGVMGGVVQQQQHTVHSVWNLRQLPGPGRNNNNR